MIALIRLCINLFFNPSQAREDLLAGFLDHNTRLQGLSSTIASIVQIKTQSAALATQVTTAQTSMGSSQSKQHSDRSFTQQQRDTALARLASNAKALQTDFLVEDKAERERLYHLLYANGMAPFQKATLGNLPTLLDTYLDLVDEETAVLGEVFVHRSHVDLDPFKEKRAQQVQQKQVTKTAQQSLNALEETLTEQLTFNYHTLSCFYRTSPETVLSFFDPRYFESQSIGTRGQRTGSIASGRTNVIVNLEDFSTPYTEVRLAVTEGGPLEFALLEQNDGTWPEGAIVVENGRPQLVPLADLPGTGTLLAVRNREARVGYFKIELNGVGG